MATDLETSVAELIVNTNIVSDVINEDATTEVSTSNGPIPSIRKALADNIYFQDPLPWSNGTNETEFNQLRTFTDGTVWWSPSATAVNPVPMGATPIGDSNWFPFQDRNLRNTILEEVTRFNIKGTFAAGFIYETVDDVGIDNSGNPWTYTGSLPFTVPAGTTPTTPTYFQENFANHNATVNRNAAGAHDERYDAVFNSVSDMTAAGAFLSSQIDAGDLSAKTRSYSNNASRREVGEGTYTITTLARARTALGDNSYTPDGFVDHYILAGTTYVAMLKVEDKINVTQGGADSTGNAESFAAIRAVHEYANDRQVDVVGVGTFLVTATNNIPVKTNADYRRATFNIPDSVNQSALFFIQQTVADTVITPSATNFVKGRTVLPDVAAYPQSVIVINSPDVFVRRNGVDVVTKRDIVFHSNDGFISHALFHNMTAITNVTIKPIESYELEFYAPSVVIAEGNITSFILSNRNQVLVYGSAVTNNTTTSNIPITTYFNPQLVMDNILDGRFRDELSPFNQAFAYDYSGGSVLRPQVRDLVTPYNWGGVDGNVYRDLLVERCITSRIGCHALAIGMQVSDSTLMEKAIQVTGGGTLKVERVTKTVNGSVGTAGFVASIVDLREDYGGEWEGDIVVEDFTIACGDIAIGSGDVAVVRLNFRGDINYGKDLAMPKRVIIERGTITTSTNTSASNEFYIVETFRSVQNQQFNTRTMPELISIKDVEVETPSGSPVIRVLPFRSPKIDSPRVEGDIEIVVDNSGISIDTSGVPLNQQGRNLRITATTSEISGVTHAEKYIFKNTQVDAIFVAPATWSLSCRFCEVYNLENFFSSVNGSGYTEARDCDIYPGRYSGSAPKAYYNCTNKVVGAVVNVEFSGGFVRAVGNSIDQNGTITGARTKTEYVNGYYDTNYFEPL